MGHPDFDVEKGRCDLEGESLLELEAWERARRVFSFHSNTPSGSGTTSRQLPRKSVASIRGKMKQRAQHSEKIDFAMESLDIPRSFMSRYVNDGFSGGRRRDSRFYS